MPDPFRLPRIKTLDRIVDALGRPTVAFIKFVNVDFAGAIERQEAAQAEIIADLEQAVLDIQALQTEQAQIISDLAQAVSDIEDIQDEQADILLEIAAEVDRLTAVLAGTGEAFTGLNVGGTNVKFFLDKTDGTQLTDPTGLAGSVVKTATLDSGAASQSIIATAATVALTAGVQTTVLSIVVTTIAGEVVDLTAQFGYLEISSAALAPLMVGQWYRGITAIVPSAVARGLDITRAADPARYVLAEGSMTVVASDVPGAGTFTYDLVVESSVVSGAINPSARLLTTTRP